MLKFALAQALVSLCVFGLLCGCRMLWRGDRPPAGRSVDHPYDVFERNGKWVAIRAERTFWWVDALAYVILFYLALPMFVYRFGWRRGVLLVLLPFAGIPLGLLFLSGSPTLGDAAPLVGTVLVVFLRAVVGFIIGVWSGDWRLATQVSRGWRGAGRSDASSRKAAVSAIRAQAAQAVAT